MQVHWGGKKIHCNKHFSESRTKIINTADTKKKHVQKFLFCFENVGETTITNTRRLDFSKDYLSLLC